jgi:hypothetical protein
MALLFIPALFFGVIAAGLFVLAIIGVVLMIALKVLSAILWVAIKIVERRSAEPDNADEFEITITIEADEPSMRDITPRDSTHQLKATAHHVR